MSSDKDTLTIRVTDGVRFLLFIFIVCAGELRILFYSLFRNERRTTKRFFAQINDEMKFRIKPNTIMGKVMKAFCKK